MDTSFDAEHEEGGICLIRARGEVDVASAPRLQAAIDAAIESKPTSMLIDLSEVSFLDSSGLRVLVDAQRRTSEMGAGFAVDGMSPALERVFEIAGLIDMLKRPE